MPQLFEVIHAAGHKPFDLQIERLIAVLRVALTTFCLAAFYMAPRGHPIPVQDMAFATPILAAYTTFGIVVALLPTLGKIRTGWQLPVHIIDIGMISLLMYFLEELSSTFFILYTFILLGATVRWNWRGALWTTLFLLVLQTALFVALGGATGFLIQYAFLIVVGGMFAFFGASRERSRDRLTELAAWPSSVAPTSADADNQRLDDSLNHIATVLQVPRVLVLWEIAQEPYWFAALFANGECRQERLPANAFGNLVAEELSNTTFASEEIDSRTCITSAGTETSKDLIVNASLQTQYKITSVCTAPFSGGICNGRVFMLDRPDWSEDDLTLTEVVASRLCIELEHHALCVRLEATAATRERIRLARDLHDGVLQSLTAVGLQLKTLASRADEKFQRMIEAVRKLLLGEQQRIRMFVDGRQISSARLPMELLGELRREIEEISRHWGCEVQLSVTPQDTKVAPELGRQLEFILAEASANAVQHGQASRIDAAIEATSEQIRLRIADNGRGLNGTTCAYNQNELAELGIGPRSLRKRITELNGSLYLSSSPSGVELRIALPRDDHAAYSFEAHQPEETARAIG